MIPLIDTIVSGVTTVIDKIVPDANIREQVKLELAQEALKWGQLDAADRDSARKRESETKDPTTRQLAFTYTYGYFGTLVGAWYWGIPESGHDFFVALFSILTGAQTAIVTYYFGSSHGSAVKDQTLGVIAKNGYH